MGKAPTVSPNVPGAVLPGGVATHIWTLMGNLAIMQPQVSCSNGYTVSSVEGTEQYWTTGANGMIPATGATDCSVTLTVDAAGYLDVASACIEVCTAHARGG